MTYGLLHLNIRRKIPRNEIDTFDDLIGKARHFETLLWEESKAKGKPEAAKENQTAVVDDTAAVSKLRWPKCETQVSHAMVVANLATSGLNVRTSKESS